ncbi:DNA polymerase III, epsilon subunit [Pelomyxa schiedti]|nr:DNA polymerase III, epsilon subunit [Pelomyxa schiedti]
MTALSREEDTMDLLQFASTQRRTVPVARVEDEDAAVVDAEEHEEGEKPPEDAEVVRGVQVIAEGDDDDNDNDGWLTQEEPEEPPRGCARGHAPRVGGDSGAGAAADTTGGNSEPPGSRDRDRDTDRPSDDDGETTEPEDGPVSGDDEADIKKPSAETEAGTTAVTSPGAPTPIIAAAPAPAPAPKSEPTAASTSASSGAPIALFSSTTCSTSSASAFSECTSTSTTAKPMSAFTALEAYAKAPISATPAPSGNQGSEPGGGRGDSTREQEPNPLLQGVEACGLLCGNETETYDAKAGGGGGRALPEWMMDPREVEKIRQEKAKILQENRSTFLHEAEEYFTQHVSDFHDPSRFFTPTQELPVEGRVVCFDLETTGFGANDCIIEIGAVELIDGVRTGLIFQSYAQPTCPIHPMAFEAHNLSEKFLMTAPPLQIPLASFISWIGDSPLVAHNARFDTRMLVQQLNKYNYTLPASNNFFCTMQYFRRHNPGLPYSLDNVASFYGVDRGFNRIVHGALLDAEILAAVFSRMRSFLG